MPTGYTSELHDGKDQTFTEFALQCARAFGATIMQRDDALSAPLRIPAPHTSYNEKALDKAQAQLDKFRGMPSELADQEAEASYQAALMRWKNAENEKRESEERYRNMLADVAGWRPPTSEHEGLKTFMVEQLEESIRFDCSTYDPPARLTGEEYQELMVAQAEKDLRYHTKSMAEEIERAVGRRAWITDLAKSLNVDVVDDVVVPA